MKDIRKIKKYANVLVSVSKSNDMGDTAQGLISFKNRYLYCYNHYPFYLIIQILLTPLYVIKEITPSRTG